MIIQSPESQMPEPYKTYVRQRSEKIAEVLGPIVGENNVQLCPKAILPDEVTFHDTQDIVYGVVVKNEMDGYKSVLYASLFDKDPQLGAVATNVEQAAVYATQQFKIGNQVRVKDPRESDGNGQTTVSDLSELAEIVAPLIEAASCAVLMPHLVRVSSRVSVGQININGVGAFNYVGQEEAQAHEGQQVYAGTTLALATSANLDGMERAALALDVSPGHMALGVKTIERFKRRALHVGRVSVDVICGVTDNGSTLLDVVDITPRVGGTTPAEVLAIAQVREDPETISIARSQLIYNPATSPTTGTNFVDTESLVINADVLEIVR